MNLVAITKQVANLESAHLTDAQAGSIRRHEHGAVFRVELGQFKQLLQFLDAVTTSSPESGCADVSGLLPYVKVLFGGQVETQVVSSSAPENPDLLQRVKPQVREVLAADVPRIERRAFPAGSVAPSGSPSAGLRQCLVTTWHGYFVVWMRCNLEIDRPQLEAYLGKVLGTGTRLLARGLSTAGFATGDPYPWVVRTGPIPRVRLTEQAEGQFR